jgi:hypothetical protein
MAGNFISGAKRDIVITKKPVPNNPAYPPGAGGGKKIQKKSEAKITNPTIPPGVIKIGLRVRQTETVDTFQLIGKNGQQLALTALPAGNPVEADLAAALGVAANEKWIVFRSNGNYNPTTFGKKFDTELVLNPFDCHPNGVRVLTVAATFDALSFEGRRQEEGRQEEEGGEAPLEALSGSRPGCRIAAARSGRSPRRGSRLGRTPRDPSATGSIQAECAWTRGRSPPRMPPAASCARTRRRSAGRRRSPTSGRPLPSAAPPGFPSGSRRSIRGSPSTPPR